MLSLPGRVTGPYGPAPRALKAAAITLALVPQAAAAEVVVAALGDSITAGYGLPTGEGLVPTLQAWLRERGSEVTVVNAGVSGDTTAGGLARIDWTLTPEVDAVIVALGGNDFLRGVDPEVSRRNLDGILDAVDEAGLPALLIGLEVSPNYGPAYKEAFDSMYPELASEHGALHHPSIFSAIEGDGTDRGAAMAFMQPDGIHPNAEGVQRIVEEIGPAVEALIERVPGA
jgi:acyl-CoA thioesterase-1